MEFAHIKRLEYMLRYQSPHGRYHAPREINPGFEEVEVIVSGYADFIKEGAPVRFGPGSSVWYHAGEVVEVVADSKDPYETIVFAFATHGLAERKHPFYSEWTTPSGCETFCREVLNCYHMGDFDINSLALCSYSRLLWEASQFEKRYRGDALPSQLQRALEYIETHFTANLAMDDIASHAGVSMSHLHLLFRKYQGTSPIQYLLKLRLDAASEKLSNSDASVKEICAEVGFNDIKNFCSAFKRRNKLTPSAYRRLTSG